MVGTIDGALEAIGSGRGFMACLNGRGTAQRESDGPVGRLLVPVEECAMKCREQHAS